MTNRLGRSSVSRVIHAGRKFDYVEMTYSLRGTPLTRTCVRHPGAVVILPILTPPPGSEIVLIRNYRFAPDRLLFELPAGGLEKDEDPTLAAARELIEETGYEAGTLTRICQFHTSPGLTDELMHAYAARDLSPVGQRLEPDEEIAVLQMYADDALEKVRSGEIQDAKTMLTLLLARDQGLI